MRAERNDVAHNGVVSISGDVQLLVLLSLSIAYGDGHFGQALMFRSPRLQISALAAIGKRLPYPNALAEIFIPGAACWRLYSLRSTMRTTRRTKAMSNPLSSAIRSGEWESST